MNIVSSVHPSFSQCHVDASKKQSKSLAFSQTSIRTVRSVAIATSCLPSQRNRFVPSIAKDGSFGVLFIVMVISFHAAGVDGFKTRSDGTALPPVRDRATSCDLDRTSRLKRTLDGCSG